MKSTHVLKLTILATSFAVFSQVAIAQQHTHDDGQMPGMGQGGTIGNGMMGRGCSMMGERKSAFVEGRIAFLKAEMAITDSQLQAFDAFAAVLKDNLQNMHAMRQGMMGGMSERTPVERLEAHVSMMEGRTASLRQVKPKLESLYAALTEQQKKKADAVLTGMGCMM